MTGDQFTLGGDPMSIMASGVQWLSFATCAGDAAAELRAAAQTSAEFSGDEGEMFRLRIEQDTATGLVVAAHAWQLVGDALIRYGAQLDACQAQLRSFAAVQAGRQSQLTALRSMAMSGAPARAAELQDDLTITSGRAAAVRADHAVAVRICVRAIDAAIALAPVPATVRGALARPPSTNLGGWTVSTMSGRLRMAAATSTQLARFGLRADDPAFAPPTAGGPTSKDDLERRLFDHCMAEEDDLDAFGDCQGFAASAVFDVAALQLAVAKYPSVLGWPKQSYGEKADWYRRFAVDMLASTLGIEDCVAGDADGCGQELAGFVLFGVAGKAIQRFARYVKNCRQARTGARTVDDLPPAVVGDDVIRQRTEEWRSAVAPASGQGAVPKRWIDVVARKIPEGWGAPIRGKASKDSRGRISIRFFGPNKRDTIRIDLGNPASPQRTQRVDHVRINVQSHRIDRNGTVLPPDYEGDDIAEIIHIPLSEWRTWSAWNHP